MSFKISIPNKNKINTPLTATRPLHREAAGTTAQLHSDINWTPSDKIRRPIQSPSGMKSGASTTRVEKDIFSKKPSFLYTSTFGSDRSPSDMDRCTSSPPASGSDIFLKKPSFLYSNSTSGAVGVVEYRANKPSFLYTASEGVDSVKQARPWTAERADTRSEVDGSEVTSLTEPNQKDNERRYSTINIKNFLNNCDSIK